MNGTKFPKMIAIVFLILALNPYNPYGYYILLRWVCCAIFVFTAVMCFENEKENWVWVFGILAFIYNPIIRIHLDRPLWTIINIISVAVIAFSLRKNKKEIDHE